MTRSAPATPAGPGTASPRTAAMAKGRQADSARRRQRVIAVLSRASSDGAEITVSGIARAAAVDRTFLYRHRDLLEKIHALEDTPPVNGDEPARPSPVRHCRPTCSRLTNAPSG